MLERAVESSEYSEISAKASRTRVWTPPEDDLPNELRLQDEELEKMEQGLYNTRPPPTALIGYGKYAVVYQDVKSPRFWEALQVLVFGILSET